ncbi:MAG: metallophosphoesterase family protein [Candidatus Hodarchaeota archaeon]
MKLGIIADVHGNPTALKLCLQVLKDLDVDEIYFLGDAIGYLPGENDVLDILYAAEVNCQKGNHEAMLLGEIAVPEEKDRLYGIHAARERISRANLEFIRGWPERREISVDGRKLFLVHGSPEDHLEGYVYSQRDFHTDNKYTYDAVFMGHTHYPFVFDLKGIQVVNVGSCGLPRDQGNLSSFALYDTSVHQTKILRLLFDSEETIESFQQISIPHEVIECLRRRSPETFGVRINRNNYG